MRDALRLDGVLPEQRKKCFLPLPYEEFSVPSVIMVPFDFISNFTPLDQLSPLPSPLSGFNFYCDREQECEIFVAYPS